MGHESFADNCLKNFDDFMFLVRSDGFESKRFTERKLTEEEQRNAGEHYRKGTGEENILRPFVELSADSKKENVGAAIGAYNVFEQMSKAGITIQQMETDPRITNLIGIAIHADWLGPNKEHPNEELKVSYSQLDEWTQQEDLTVFAALLEVVKNNPEKFAIAYEEGYKLPDYEAREAEILAELKSNKHGRK